MTLSDCHQLTERLFAVWIPYLPYALAIYIDSCHHTKGTRKLPADRKINTCAQTTTAAGERGILRVIRVWEGDLDWLCDVLSDPQANLDWQGVRWSPKHPFSDAYL